MIGGLIQQQDLRALGQGPGDMHALSLTTREPAPGTVAQMRSIHIGQCLLDNGRVPG